MKASFRAVLMATGMVFASAYGASAALYLQASSGETQLATDTKGRVLNEAQTPALDDSMRTLDARNAFVMDSLLQSVAARGTAAAAQRSLARTDLYGKTGTTNDSIDTWFAGFQRSVVAIVWIGYDNPRKLGDNETGGGLALPIWIEYMKHALKGVPVQPFTPPEGVINMNDEWYYEEYARGSGVSSLGLEDKMPANAPAAPNEDERKSILDLFKR